MNKSFVKKMQEYRHNFI